jgi:hypothetical protein
MFAMLPFVYIDVRTWPSACKSGSPKMTQQPARPLKLCKCMAYQYFHLVNAATGKVLSEEMDLKRKVVG